MSLGMEDETAALSMWRDEMRADASRPFFSLFIDGRNEHGSHVLSTPRASIDDELHVKGVLDLLEDQDEGIAERIICDAEAMGFEIGQHITTIWRHTNDSGEMNGDYFEYMQISWPLSVLFFGTPDEQNNAHKAMERRMSGHPESYVLTRDDWLLLNRTLCGASLSLSPNIRADRDKNEGRAKRIRQSLAVLSRIYKEAKQ